MTLQEYLASCPKKQLIFDFDETLVHLILPWKEFKNKLHAVLGKLDPDIKLDVRKSMVLYINEFVKRNGGEGRKIVLKLFEEFELSQLQSYPQNRDLFDFIKNNNSKYSFYIWSSNMTVTITHLLQKLAYIKFFKKIIGRDSVIFTKPEPDGFSKIYDPKTQHKKDYLLIGDSDHDKNASQKAGIDYFKIQFKVE
jgi:HAD superfamily hydrolase (TIGR01549 family)